ncbi:hypothetical protein LINPERPRIM_LOCUS15265 [Linum perenne]
MAHFHLCCIPEILSSVQRHNGTCRQGIGDVAQSSRRQWRIPQAHVQNSRQKYVNVMYYSVLASQLLFLSVGI